MKDELLKMLEGQMAETKAQYDKIEARMAELQEQSRQMQEEYNALNAQRLEIKGKHIGFYETYLNLKNQEGTPVVAPKEEKVVQMPKEPAKPKAKKETAKADNTLSAEEVAKVKAQLAKSVKNQPITNPEDIPEYLQEEYKK